jgi:hypothetical protein
VTQNPDNPTLREYLEKLVEMQGRDLHALRELMDQKFRSMENALTLAQTQLSEYKASANEWRGQSKDQQQMFLARTEAYAKFEGFDKEIRSLRETRAGVETGQAVKLGDRLQLNWAVGIVLGVLGLIAGIMFRR